MRGECSGRKNNKSKDQDCVGLCSKNYAEGSVAAGQRVRRGLVGNGSK